MATADAAFWTAACTNDAGASLTLHTVSGTDAWSNTYYNFPDPMNNVHFCGISVEDREEVVLEATVCVEPTGRYDQAGVMVRVSDRCWLKASIEFIPDGPSHFGAVVTNGGWSDWSTQDVEPLRREEGGGSGALLTAAQYRVHRLAGGDYVVEGRMCDEVGVPRGDRWSQLRLCHLHDDPWGAEHPGCGTGGSGCPPHGEERGGRVEVGVYACSPLGPGCKTTFQGVRVHRHARLFPTP